MRKHLLPLAGFIVLAAPAFADEQSNEDRLRDALRQSVTQMRAAQDQAATLQSQLTTAQQEKAALQAKLDDATAKLGETAGKPVAKPAELQQLQADLQAARQQTAAVQAGIAKWQGAYNSAVDVARAKDAESQRAAAAVKANSVALNTCKVANKKLIDVAQSVLHLYESQSFHSILVKSYEPFVGAAKVDLENIVQDYDDKIREQEYFEPKPAGK